MGSSFIFSKVKVNCSKITRATEFQITEVAGSFSIFGKTKRIA